MRIQEKIFSPLKVERIKMTRYAIYIIHFTPDDETCYIGSTTGFIQDALKHHIQNKQSAVYKHIQNHHNGDKSVCNVKHSNNEYWVDDIESRICLNEEIEFYKHEYRALGFNVLGKTKN